MSSEGSFFLPVLVGRMKTWKVSDESSESATRTFCNRMERVKFAKFYKMITQFKYYVPIYSLYCLLIFKYDLHYLFQKKANFFLFTYIFIYFIIFHSTFNLKMKSLAVMIIQCIYIYIYTLRVYNLRYVSCF